MLAPRSSGRNPKVSIKTLFVYLATATTLACSGGSSRSVWHVRHDVLDHIVGQGLQITTHVTEAQ
jgi:hypothetical protein